VRLVERKMACGMSFIRFPAIFLAEISPQFKLRRSLKDRAYAFRMLRKSPILRYSDRDECACLWGTAQAYF
jgi:hypothetical protein